MKLAMVIGIAAMTIQCAAAENAYLCVPTKSVGFAFNRAKHEWDAARFVVTGRKYLLMHGRTTWDWYEAGNPTPIPEYCEPDDVDFINCGGVEDIRLNRKSLRFQLIDAHGYVADSDPRHPEGLASPKMEIGTCTVIENPDNETKRKALGRSART